MTFKCEPEREHPRKWPPIWMKHKYCANTVHSSDDGTNLRSPSLPHSIARIAKWKKNSTRKLFRFLLLSVFCDAKNVDCRLQSSILVLWPSVPCQKCKYKSFDHQKVRWRKIVCHLFPFKRNSLSYRARWTETQCHLHCVWAVCVCSRSVVNSFFIGYLTDI